MNKEVARKIIADRLKKKNKRLELPIIEDLAEELIDNLDFISKHNLSVDDLPNRNDIKWWFQEPPPENLQIEVEPGKYEDLYEVSIDNICLKDKLATKIFKYLYKWSWQQGEPIPDEVKEMIQINNMAHKSTNKENKTAARVRIINLTMVGIVRYYHIENKPYLCPTQIKQACDFLKSTLAFLSGVVKGKYDKKIITGRINIFDPFC
jgi:hypothetical protein